MSSRFTWTSAFGKGSGWLLQKIVNGLALSKISPNTLTFIGLIINVAAAFFFGYARGGPTRCRSLERFLIRLSTVTVT